MHEGRIWEQGPPQELFDAPKSLELQSFLAAIFRRSAGAEAPPGMVQQQ